MYTLPTNAPRVVKKPMVLATQVYPQRREEEEEVLSAILCVCVCVCVCVRMARALCVESLPFAARGSTGRGAHPCCVLLVLLVLRLCA